MNLLIRDEKLLKKYNTVWDKLNNLVKKEFNSELVYNDKYTKDKIRLYNVNFHGNKMPKK